MTVHKEIFSEEVLNEFDPETSDGYSRCVEQASLPLTDLIEMLCEHYNVLELSSNVGVLAKSFVSAMCVENSQLKEESGANVFSPEAALWVPQLLDGIFGVEEGSDATKKFQILLVLGFLYETILSHLPALLPFLVKSNDKFDELPSSEMSRDRAVDCAHIRDLRALLKDTVLQLISCREEVLQKRKVSLNYVYLSLCIRSISRVCRCFPGEQEDTTRALQDHEVGGEVGQLITALFSAFCVRDCWAHSSVLVGARYFSALLSSWPCE